MNPQLQLLLEIQDLRGQYRELGSKEGGPGLGSLEEEHFGVDPAQARDTLEEKIGELVEQLSPPIRARFQQIAPSRDRVVVPVIHGVCYGCFVSIPTATAGDRDVHQDLASCQSCGRFIYVLH
jgi:predicted  nucleic acid-binding Zn-ribbon protein